MDPNQGSGGYSGEGPSWALREEWQGRNVAGDLLP
jgi:hypothetical protein